MKRLIPVVMIFASALGSIAQEPVPAADMVKYVKLLLSSTGQTGFACGSNMSLRFKLQSMGISTATNAKIAWASSENEVKALKAGGRFVVVPNLAWLKLGGAVAIVQENGNPVVYLHQANAKASGLTLSESFVKAAKVSP